MASIRITIETDGAAFHGGGNAKSSSQWAKLQVDDELALVLRGLQEQLVWRYVDELIPLDSNDNPCGKVELLD